jgi:hypothetical protein
VYDEELLLPGVYGVELPRPGVYDVEKTPYTTSSATPMDVNCSVIVGKHYRGGESNVWLIQESFVVTLSIFRNIEKQKILM